MRRATLSIAAIGFAMFIVSARGSSESGDRVDVVARAAERRVDVTIGGKPFTAYLFGTTVKKPILYPLRTARGTIVTRGFPLEPRPGERTDHPHQVGHWFNHGDVNGFDFWGHSDQTPAALRAKAGTIVHAGITRAVSGGGEGTLAITADWIVPDGTKLLAERSEFIFRGRPDWRAIDRLTTWTPAAGPVVFGDTKEGSFGIRVARTLEQPSTQPDTFVSQSGQAETVPRLDGTRVTGQYLGSDGKTGDAVWGTRGPWMALTGTVDDEAVTVAIFDHPNNPGQPTHWHARGYGLFAANPFGRQGFDPKHEKAPVTLPVGRSLSFHHRILIRPGQLTRNELQLEYDRFVGGSQ